VADEETWVTVRCHRWYCSRPGLELSGQCGEGVGGVCGGGAREFATTFLRTGTRRREPRIRCFNPKHQPIHLHRNRDTVALEETPIGPTARK
jgi:hypothetical protein